MDWKLQPHIFSHSAQTTFMHTHETGSDFFEAAYPILRTLLVLPAGGVCLQSAGDRLPRVHPLDHDAHRRYGCGGAVSAPRGGTAENAAAAMPLRSTADHGTGIHCGVADNLVMGWNVWDYSSMPLNLYGQICLPFSGLWFLLCIPAFGICSIAAKRFRLPA